MEEQMAKAAIRRAVATLTDDCCVPSLLAEPLADADAADLAAAFAALGDPTRLRCLSLIANAGECCSCDLEGPLRRAQPTISHHTKALADAGLIVGEKRGRWMWWQVVPERLAELQAALGLQAGRRDRRSRT
jgi:ArsR family transcriptional regulator